jgi:hypothetical protein
MEADLEAKNRLLNISNQEIALISKITALLTF